VLVSHDRDFINEVATRIVELHDGIATEYVGDYATSSTSAPSGSPRSSARHAPGRKVAQLERFIERFRYKKTKARQVQSRSNSSTGWSASRCAIRGSSR
jgi:ATP-binding cassette subfamily F protein 3